MDLLTLTIINAQDPMRMLATKRVRFSMRDWWPIHAKCAAEEVESFLVLPPLRDGCLRNLSEGPSVHGRVCIACDQY